MVFGGKQNKRNDNYKGIQVSNYKMAQRILKRKSNITNLESLDNQFQKNRNVFNNISKYKKNEQGRLVMKGGLIYTEGRFRQAGKSYLSMSIKSSPRKSIDLSKGNTRSTLNSANLKRSKNSKQSHSPSVKLHNSMLNDRLNNSIENNSRLHKSYICTNDSKFYRTTCDTNKVQFLDQRKEGYLRGKNDYKTMLMMPSLLSKSLIRNSNRSLNDQDLNKIALKDNANEKQISILKTRILSGYRENYKPLNPENVKRLTRYPKQRKPKIIKKKQE